MIIYRVKIKIQKTKENDWFEWMYETHIPDVLNTRHFLDYSFLKLLENGKMDEDCSTYEIQYVCKSREELDKYVKDDAPKLREEHKQLFGTYIKDTERSILDDVTKLQLIEA